MTGVTIRHVHVKLEQELWERAERAARADRRSLTNWIAVLIERALEDKPRDAAGQPARPELFRSAARRRVQVLALHTPAR
jgi:hypothetical protein